MDYKRVNISKVVKVVKDKSPFMLLPVTEDVNLLVTRTFILNLDEKQFWKIQCKLEAKDHGIWLSKVDGEWCQANGASVESVKEMYFSTINATHAELLKNTDLIQKGYIALFCNEQEYFGVQNDYIDMIPGGVPTVKRLPKTLHFILDDVHIAAPIDLKSGEMQCPYLRNPIGS